MILCSISINRMLPANLEIFDQNKQIKQNKTKKKNLVSLPGSSHALREITFDLGLEISVSIF